MKLTTQEKFQKMLYDYGLFEDQAHEVVEYVKPFITTTGGYKITWDRPADEYPEVVYGAVFIFMAPYVIEWAGKNCPDAWWIPMFRAEVKDGK